jgi:hypothetical protein
MMNETIPTGNYLVKEKLPLGNLPISNYPPKCKSMDRRKALELLINENYPSVAEFGRAVGLDPSYISRCMWPEDKKGYKKIGVEIIDAIGMVHPFWDYEYSSKAFKAKRVVGAKSSPLTVELVDIFEDLQNADDKKAVIALAYRLASTQNKSPGNSTTRSSKENTKKVA